MANTRELRRRIKSIKNTSQITKAMQMVAATKMRKAQNQALAGRPYDLTLTQALTKLRAKASDDIHPFFHSQGGETIGVLFIATDKSLCGSLNTNLFRTVLSFSSGKKNLSFFTVGKKARNFVVKTGHHLEADFENAEVVEFRLAKQIGKLITPLFLDGQLAEVYLAYPDFISTLKQEPNIVKLLPISPDVLDSQTRFHLTGATNGEFLFEPNPNDLLGFVLNHQIEIRIYQALLETKASEHSARMMAMQNATDNANELIGDLQLSYNQIRQAGITNELLEITSAGAVLE